jgi:hypothetical protein
MTDRGDGEASHGLEVADEMDRFTRVVVHLNRRNASTNHGSMD